MRSTEVAPPTPGDTTGEEATVFGIIRCECDNTEGRLTPRGAATTLPSGGTNALAGTYSIPSTPFSRLISARVDNWPEAAPFIFHFSNATPSFLHGHIQLGTATGSEIGFRMWEAGSEAIPSGDW